MSSATLHKTRAASLLCLRAGRAYFASVSVFLVPVDFSAVSRGGTERAADLAVALGADLVLLHVAQIPPGLDAGSRIRPLPDRDPVPAGEFVRDASMAELERHASELRRRGITVRSRVEIGEPVEVILRVAAEVDPAMIVIGTHGRSGIARVLLGSIAERILRMADRPVVTVPLRSIR